VLACLCRLSAAQQLELENQKMEEQLRQVQLLMEKDLEKKRIQAI
jgi:hypothetical protein